MNPVLKVHVLPDSCVGVPWYATEGAAGMDLQANLADSLTLEPGRRATIPTGLRIAVPDGYEAQLRPRSGLASKHGIGMVNSPATIDADYRGQVHVLLINLGQEPYTIRPGERIAQMVIAPVTRVSVEEVSVEDLGETVRGEGGLGSTGK